MTVRHPTIQAIFDLMLEQTIHENRVWTSEEWRTGVESVAEEVPALKLVLADATDEWTNDQWFETVEQVGGGTEESDGL